MEHVQGSWQETEQRMGAGQRIESPGAGAMGRKVLLVVALAALLVGAHPARAAAGEVVRVRVQMAAVYEYMRTGSSVVMTVPAGTLLEVLGKEGDWFWVVLPPDSNGTRRAGYIQAFLVEVVEPASAPAGARPAGQAAAPVPESRPKVRQAGPRSWDGRYFVRFNGGYQSSASSFGSAAVFPVYREEATAVTADHVARGRVFDLSGGVRVGRHVSVGLGVAGFASHDPAAVTGTIPHPFFFEQPRPISGEAASLAREEIGVHPEIGVRIPVVDRVDLTVFAGPSVFRVRQDVVTAIRFTEVYPYDAPLFEGVETERVADTAVGFHAGVDLACNLWRFVGIGIGARFTRADVQLPAPDHDVRVRAGGIQVIGGVRVRF